jgi:hypothetical protein
VGLTLPGELERLLNDLGFTWPEVDETELVAVGLAWAGLGGHLSGVVPDAHAAVQTLAAGNRGEAMDAFLAQWSGPDAPAAVLADTVTGVQVGGAAVLTCAGIVLAVKTYTIVNLTILAVEIAEAVATAVPTCGASLAEIPLFKELTSRVIGAIVNEAIMAIMD